MPLSPKCPRCNLAFGTKDPKCPQGPRMPLMLDCGHTFCSDCLARVAKQQRTAIVCHTCQQSTELSEECSVKTLWPDVYVHGLLAVNRSGFVTQPQVMEFQKPSSNLFNKTPPKPNLCEECSVKTATCRCLKCDVILCGVCFEKIHRVSNVLRQHHAEPYNARDSDVNYGKGIFPMCVLHKRSNEFYCTEEDVAFCAACAGIGCHKDHLVITVEDKEKSDLENLNTVLGQANNILQHSKKSSQLINSIVPACQSHGSRLIERLQEHFLQLHGTLQAREHSLIETLLKSFQKDIGPVVEMETTLVEQIRKIETLIGDARAVISGTKRNLKGCQVLEQLTDVLDVPCYATVAGGGNLQIQFKCEDEKLLSEMRVHGEWDGRFVENLKLDRLSDVSVMNERGEHVPLSPPSGRISTIQTMLPLPFEMKNGGSDLDSISLNSDHERPTHHDLETESMKFKPRDNLMEIPLPKSKFKVHSELVHVSHIYNPCSFYVNLSRDLSTLAMLSRNIHTHCSYTGKQDIPTELDVGDQVLAQFSQDGQWYRAQVIEVNDITPVSPTTIRVLYTDYGNKELTTIDRIRNIHPRFMQHPKMAKQCTLVDIVPANGDRWSNETISTFARITKDRPMIMSVIKEVGDLWYVDLSRPASEEIEDDGPVSVRDALVFLDLASFISPHSVPSKIGGVKQRCYLRPGLPQLGESVRVTLTFVSSPHDFYVQMLGSESRHLQELMMNMQKTYEEDRGDLYTMFCPAKGMLCAAKYAHDGLWYRAEVVELKGGCQVRIRYVDYGNIELMSVWKLKKLLDVYLVLPAQAVHCRLADVGPAEETGQWQTEATAFLSKLLYEPELTVKVKEVINRWTLSVYLHSEMMLHSVNTSMISNGWAMATGPGWEPAPKTPRSLFLMARQQKIQETNESAKPSVTLASQPSSTNASSTTMVNGEQEEPKCPKVIVSHVVSPGEFYVQDSEKVRALQQLMTKLNAEDKKSCPVNQWKIADVCAVHTAVDKCWYRAQIASIEESSAEVFLVDFGYKYTVELSCLLVLPDSLKSVTRFTIRCHFAEIVPAGDPSRWSQTSCDALKSLVLNKTCYLVVKSDMDELSSLPVDLLLGVFLKGGAVTPDKTLYNSVADVLRDKGLALKKRNSCPTTVIPPRDVASTAHHVTSEAVPVSNQLPTTAGEVAASSEQPKEEQTTLVQSPTVEASDGDYPPPDIPPSDRLVLGVTHVDKSGVIYGQEIKADLRYLQQLMDRVANHYKNSSPSIGRKWRKGELVVAQYTEDDGFYRAKILSLSGDFAEVYYVDYGNKETLSTERLRPAIFTDEPAQCYQCRLHGLAWNSGDDTPSDDTYNSLYQLLVGKVCNLRIKEKAGPGFPFAVDITTSEGKDLSQFLIDARYAVRHELSPDNQDQNLSAVSSTSDPTVHQHPSPAKASQSLSAPKLTPGRTEGLTVKSENKPSAVGLLKSGANCPSQDASPVVRETPVEPSTESRRPLTSYAVESSDKGIPQAFPHPCGYGGWVDDADGSRSGAVACRIPKRKVPSPYPQLPEPKVGEMMIMTVTQVDAPDLVYLQCIKLENVTEDNIIEVNNQLDMLLELNKWYGFSHVTCPVLTADQLTPGCPCIAQFSVDECWYRAEIVDVRLTREESLEVDVLFVDYGSSDCLKKLENLRSIPKDHISLPAQSVLCHLDGILPRKNWDTVDLHRVQDVVRHKVLITSVKNVQNGEIFVDLFEQEVYTREGVIAPLVYQPLVDEGILMTVSPAHAASLTNEDSGELICSENGSVRNPSTSNIEEAELLDDPVTDV